MQPHKIVSREEWVESRKALMAHEKEFTRSRDRLNEERRALPWVRVDKTYVFDSAAGRKTLADLFGGRSQLAVQHFMFAPDWNEGCKSCSFWADQFDRMIPHLAARDTALVAVSRAPLQKLEAFKARMDWTFDWFSSANTDFNHDYAVSFTPEEIKSGAKIYNFGTSGFGVEEAPGDQRVLSRRKRRYLSHLFVFRARPRHDERRLSLSRSHSARTPRRRLVLSNGLASAARSV